MIVSASATAVLANNVGSLKRRRVGQEPILDSIINFITGRLGTDPQAIPR
ncbi:hypothetical protein [Bradyrhizobium sp. MOS001]|nr:hypothetical protein [Bradyrhizobium sp. MOS001]